MYTALIAASSRKGFDEDAQAFFDAAGITNSGQKNAVNSMVLDLKSNSFYTRFIALYPFVGGTADTHKYNLIDPQDTDGAYRLTFGASTTHSSSGSMGSNDASTDTHIAGTTLAPFDNSMHFYSVSGSIPPTSGNDRELDIGRNPDHYLGVNFNQTVGYANNYDNATEESFGARSVKGFFSNSRTSSVEYKLYENGTAFLTGSRTTGSMSSDDLHILGANNGNFQSSKIFAFAAFGTGFSESEMATLNTIVSNYQTALTRSSV